MRESRYKRGSTLILSLFISLIIFTAGIGFLSQTASQYRSANESGRSTQVLAIAEAGIADALLKLQRDLDFPPRSANDQVVYTYLEDLTDTDGTRVGSYEVAIDRSLVVRGQELLIIRSTGRLGPAENPLSEKTIRIEFDRDPTRASYFQVTSWTDLGGF